MSVLSVPVPVWKPRREGIRRFSSPGISYYEITSTLPVAGYAGTPTGRGEPKPKPATAKPKPMDALLGPEKTKRLRREAQQQERDLKRLLRSHPCESDSARNASTLTVVVAVTAVVSQPLVSCNPDWTRKRSLERWKRSSLNRGQRPHRWSRSTCARSSPLHRLQMLRLLELAALAKWMQFGRP